ATLTRQKVAGNLHRVGVALHTYHDTHGTLPAPAIFSKDGKPLLSWRVALLPILGKPGQDLYKQFKLHEPWDSRHNKDLLARMPSCFVPPGGKAADGLTAYRVFVGKGAAFEGKEGLRMSSFTDGLSNTALVVEAAPVPWTKPEELAFDPAGPLPKVGTPTAD